MYAGRIIIEGPWGSGKTRLAKRILRHFPRSVFFAEPDHKKLRRPPSNDQEWYYKSYLRREKYTGKRQNTNKMVLMERSIFSLYAYKYAVLQKKTLIPKKIKTKLKPIDILIVLKPSSVSKTKLRTIKIPQLHRDPLAVNKRYYNFLVSNKNKLPAKKMLVGSGEQIFNKIKNIVETV